MNAMVPRKITRHETTPMTISILVELDIWCIVKLLVKIWIVKKIPDHNIWIAIPNLVAGKFPTWGIWP